jgi:predicted  nucleic acid-binding Zn-ribbon protein
MEVRRLRMELEDIPNQMAQFTSESSEMTKQMENGSEPAPTAEFNEACLNMVNLNLL